MRINRNEIVILSIKLATLHGLVASSQRKKESIMTLKKNNAIHYNGAYDIDIKYELIGHQPADYTQKSNQEKKSSAY